MKWATLSVCPSGDLSGSSEILKAGYVKNEPITNAGSVLGN